MPTIMLTPTIYTVSPSFLLEVGSAGQPDKLSLTSMTITDYYVTTDAMGSVTAILDEEGNVLERRRYDAFGEMTCMAPDGTPVAESLTGLDVGFQGQIRDEGTGLYQMGYRWYNPVLGRWLSRDLIGLSGGSNLTRALGNAPQMAYDYYGLAGYAEMNDKRVGFIKASDGVSEEYSSEGRFLSAVRLLPRYIGPATQSRETRLEDPWGFEHSPDWRSVITGNMTKDVSIVLDRGCSLTVAFHARMSSTGSALPERSIAQICEKIRCISRSASTPCPRGPNSITLLSCFGATNGNAQAIANSTGVPVVAAGGSGSVYAYERTKNGRVEFHVDSPEFSGSAGPEAMKNWAYELKQTRAAKNPAFRWEVVFPKSLR